MWDFAEEKGIKDNAARNKCKNALSFLFLHDEKRL